MAKGGSKKNKGRSSRPFTAEGTDSYPIPDVAHLRKAILAFGRAKNPRKIKAHIISRARALHRTDLLPEKWGVKASVVAGVVADTGPDVAQSGGGIMVAAYPPPDVSSALENDPDDVGDPHVTLCYLGKTDDWSSDDLDAALNAIEQVCIGAAPLSAHITGVAQFEDGGDGSPQVYLVDAPGLAQLRSDIFTACSNAGVTPRVDHDFMPHMTARYGGAPLSLDDLPSESDDDEGVWPIDALVFVVGNQSTLLPLGHGYADDGDGDGCLLCDDEEDDHPDDVPDWYFADDGPAPASPVTVSQGGGVG